MNFLNGYQMQEIINKATGPSEKYLKASVLRLIFYFHYIFSFGSKIVIGKSHKGVIIYSVRYNIQFRNNS